jgi:hypothetical protein
MAMARIGNPHGRGRRRRHLHAGWLAAGALLLAGAGLLVPAGASPAEAVAPQNTSEPTISGRAEQGRTLSASRGRWTGSGSITYAYRWVRCGANGGLPDGSDCVSITGATRSDYVLQPADVGFRMRVRVSATNSDGSQTVASNPTGTVVGPPTLVRQPLVTGATLNGSTVRADPGVWSGRQPISFTYRWLRCNSAGGDCVAPGPTGRTYRLTSADVGHRIRFEVTARNAVGTATTLSGESAIVSEPLPSGAVKLPTGEVSIPAGSVPSNQRLVAAEVHFSPSVVTSRKRTIMVRIRVKDTRGYVVRDAFVFIRSTPKVTTGGDRRLTAADGWLTYELVPEVNFPTKAKTAVQFFVKAYRGGDPALGGVYGSRLVQIAVRLH